MHRKVYVLHTMYDGYGGVKDTRTGKCNSLFPPSPHPISPLSPTSPSPSVISQLQTITRTSKSLALGSKPIFHVFFFLLEGKPILYEPVFCWVGRSGVGGAEGLSQFPKKCEKLHLHAPFGALFCRGSFDLISKFFYFCLSRNQGFTVTLLNR